MNALAVVPERQALTASPVFRGAEMAQALKDYRELQHALDASMPDQLMKLDGKDFRRKGYWRAVAVAFNLSVEPTTHPHSERSVIGTLEDGSDNYVYTVIYQARTSGGRHASGDGTCAASEKERGRMRASEHNVRSHAHTRAYNRAVSNLVGFGEVSAEEVDRAGHDDSPPDPVKREDGSVIVIDVKEVKGGKPGQKAWTRYDVHFDDGSRAATFDASLARAASQAKLDGVLCIPVMEKTERGVNLLTLTPASLVVKDGPVEAAQQGFEDDVERAALNDEVVRLGNKAKMKSAERATAWETYCRSYGPEDVPLEMLNDLVKYLRTRAGE